MSLPLSSSSTVVISSKETFEAVLQHWAAARIDGPLKVTERFDEAAKQLIVVGGLMQGLFFAVLALKPESQAPLWSIVVFFLPLIALVFCAAKVICTVPMNMEAINTYTLMRRAVEGVPDSDLAAAVEKWCEGIDDNTKKKHRWLFAANMLFLASSVLAVFVLLPFILM